MQKASVAVNESFGEIIVSPSFTTTTTAIATATATTKAIQTTTTTANQNDLDCQSELIDSNMEEICTNLSTGDVNESNKDAVQTEETALSACDEHKNVSESMAAAAEAAIVPPTAVASLPSGKSPVHSESSTKTKAVVIMSPNTVETICDDISSTTKDIKRLKHVQVRSNSTGKLYQSSRRVSFPENDSELVTGYLEPADPWACGKWNHTTKQPSICHLHFDRTSINLLSDLICAHFCSIVFDSMTVKPATCVSELAEFYRDSCRRHNALPIETIMKHLDTLDLKSNTRRPVLNLREQNLTAESCEALEEVLKRVSHIYYINHSLRPPSICLSLSLFLSVKHLMRS